MIDAESLHRHPNALQGHYRQFRVAERLLLTGHSHQAWPDCSLEGQRQAWLDASLHVDEKWERAFAQADGVRSGFARLLCDDTGDIALSGSTHDLVVRFLSALPLRDRPRLVTTDGEFHTIRRQLNRLAEEGVEIVKVPARPAIEIAPRLAAATDERTAAVLVSSVLFQSGQLVPGLSTVLERCQAKGTALLVDAYHALNVVPVSLPQEGLQDAFVVGGGYKYCQLGEGNCFLRTPPGCTLRPVITGWFSEFGALTGDHGDSVGYGPGPARFAGATYDPTSHYRAAVVFDFFRDQGLTPALLRQVSQHQIELLVRLFDDLDADPEVIDRDRSVALEQLGGFLVLTTPHAVSLHGLLADRGVSTDFRGPALRLGPAPYLSDAQLTDAMGLLGDALKAL